MVLFYLLMSFKDETSNTHAQMHVPVATGEKVIQQSSYSRSIRKLGITKHSTTVNAIKICNV
jgi:hypothetical protein